MQGELRLNAFTGAPPRASGFHPEANRWIGAAIPAPARPLGEPHRRGGGPPPLADLRRFEDPEVGWGLVLPDAPGLDPALRARADDAPEPLRRLLEHRAGVVLRWSPELKTNKLRRYYMDGSCQDADLVLSARGVARGRLPRYLLLAGSPEALPWALQFRLNAVAFTGRLDLEPAGLAHHVDALLSGWDGAAALATTAVTWAVDHGAADITRLMRRTVAKKLHDAFESDAAMRSVFLDGGVEPATHAALVAALVEHRPGLIVTSSHGMTGPLDDVPRMRASLGLPVDADYQALDLGALLSAWSPDGAIWFAQACCSAGGDARSAYQGLVEAGSEAAEVLEGVARCGARVAPLPRLLLGAERPLRAFLGHVEPTFDWTLQDPDTGQVLTSAIAEALYRQLFQPLPIGYALQSLTEKAPQLERMHQDALNDAKYDPIADRRAERLKDALRLRLVAQDLASLVLLGDPAELPFLGPP